MRRGARGRRRDAGARRRGPAGAGVRRRRTGRWPGLRRFRPGEPTPGSGDAWARRCRSGRYPGATESPRPDRGGPVPSHADVAARTPEPGAGVRRRRSGGAGLRRSRPGEPTPGPAEPPRRPSGVTAPPTSGRAPAATCSDAEARESNRPDAWARWRRANRRPHARKPRRRRPGDQPPREPRSDAAVRRTIGLNGPPPAPNRPAARARRRRTGRLPDARDPLRTHPGAATPTASRPGGAG